MPSIVLYQPEIPPNTGNIIRLCANTGVDLHLIHPLGFSVDDKQLKRAGLDYHEWARVQHHPNYEAFIQQIPAGKRIFACSVRGSQTYTEVEYQPDDYLMFGTETQGLPKNVLNSMGMNTIRIPMQAASRSLNLSNSVSIILYESLRQIGFEKLCME